MTDRNDPTRERSADRPSEDRDTERETERKQPEDDTATVAPDRSRLTDHDLDDDVIVVDSGAGESSTTTVVADGSTATAYDATASDVIVVDRDRDDSDRVDRDDNDRRDSTLTDATMSGGPADHLGMRAESDDHMPDGLGHHAPVDSSMIPGSAGGDLASPGLDPVDIGLDLPGSSPRDDEKTLDQNESPLDQTPDPYGGLGGDLPSSLYDNPAVVGADREAEMLAAADPDLTGMVDIDGIAGGQVGGTIDGRTPYGAGADGGSSGFQATSGWGGGDTLDGAAGLTNAHNAAAAVQKGIDDFGHGSFTVHDAFTGEPVYGPGVHKGGAEWGQQGAGSKGEYILKPTGDAGGDGAGDGGGETAASSHPGAGTVKVTDDGVSGGKESAYSDEPAWKNVADFFMGGASDSPKNEALKQAEQEIQANSAPPPAPEKPDDTPETEMPADPDAGGPPPAGLDLSTEWAIKVWAKANADINPNPMADGTGPAEVMAIDGFVEQYDEPMSAPTLDPDALIDEYNDSIDEQFDDLDG